MYIGDILQRSRNVVAAILFLTFAALFFTSLTMKPLESDSGLKGIYPADIHSQESRRKAEAEFYRERDAQLTPKGALERYSACALILSLGVLFLPKLTALTESIRSRRYRQISLYVLIPASIVAGEVLVTSVNLDRMMYPTWQDNIVVNWFATALAAVTVAIVLLPFFIYSLTQQSVVRGSSSSRVARVFSLVLLSISIPLFLVALALGQAQMLLLSSLLAIFVLPGTDYFAKKGVG
ncbi:hypothetical protein [Pseudomonas nicosulfuronedens]